MDPIVLTTYKSPFPKIRLGKNFDGGYIIADISNINYSVLLSGGIDCDISFEEAFLKKYDSTKCYAFDGTIKKLPIVNEKIIFIKKNIGDINNDNITNLHDIIEKYDNIFIKMDIEGGEIPWILSLSDDHLLKFEQIVIEFHNPFTAKELEVFKKINKNHYLIHFHPNNCCGPIKCKGINIPEVFECTYLHKKYFKESPELNTDPIPSNIDMKNINQKKDIYINYPPFVN